MMVFHGRPPKRLPRYRAVYNRDGVYDGWTGFEYFGVIWPFRYYGWRVTCWSTVMAAYYGQGNISVFFDTLDASIRELDRLMDKADSMGQLAKKRRRAKKSRPYTKMELEEIERIDRESDNTELVPVDTVASNLGSPAYYRRLLETTDGPHPLMSPEEMAGPLRWGGNSTQ